MSNYRLTHLGVAMTMRALLAPARAGIPVYCGACDVALDAKSNCTLGMYKAPHGEQYPHLLCESCSLKIVSGKAGHREVANAVEMHYWPAEGQA